MTEKEIAYNKADNVCKQADKDYGIMLKKCAVSNENRNKAYKLRQLAFMAVLEDKGKEG